MRFLIISENENLIAFDKSKFRNHLYFNINFFLFCISRTNVDIRGSNIKLAVELSIEIQTEMFYTDHTLHLIVTKNSNKIKVVKNALVKCSLLAAYVPRSTLY